MVRDELDMCGLSADARCSKGPASVSCMSCSLGISYEEMFWSDWSSSCSSNPSLILIELAVVNGDDEVERAPRSLCENHVHAFIDLSRDHSPSQCGHGFLEESGPPTSTMVSQ